MPVFSTVDHVFTGDGFSQIVSVDEICRITQSFCAPEYSYVSMMIPLEFVRVMDSFPELLRAILVSEYGSSLLSWERIMEELGKIYILLLASERLYQARSIVSQPVFLISIYSPNVSSQIGFGNSEIKSIPAKLLIGKIQRYIQVIIKNFLNHFLEEKDKYIIINYIFQQYIH